MQNSCFLCIPFFLWNFTAEMSVPSSNEGPIPLPDIRDQLKRKELQEKIAQMEAEEEAKKVKIKRSDKEAFTKVSLACSLLSFVFLLRQLLRLLECSMLNFYTVFSNTICNTCVPVHHFSPTAISFWNLNPLPTRMIRILRKKLTVPLAHYWENVPNHSWVSPRVRCKWDTLLVPWELS